LPELVIKKDKTVPEFGGGLCQIATTIFRAVLASGLPILERQSHSYRVPYYEPAGVDATVYDPRPDFKFLNDTGYHILIQSKIEGNFLIFEFWGTKDGRAVEQSKPVIYNVKPAPPSKLIETLDLPVGKKKCTERAHTGADAVFTYTVTYADSAVKKQEFRSRYKPWGEVCLIGVEKLSEPPALEGDEANGASSSTPSTSP
jgi:vancomycin resistance protein YoaR